MQLDFTDEQEELRDGVRAVLARECPPERVRAALGDPGVAPALYAQMVELGWPALTVPDTEGGLGSGPVELALVAEELGAALAPGPFLATTSQFAPVVRELGDAEQRARFLGGVADGSVVGALALTEPGGIWDPAQLTTVATWADGAVRITGHTLVLEASAADELAVVARDDAGAIVAALVPTPAVRVEPVVGLDLTRALARVHLDDVTVSADRVLAEPGPATERGLARALEEAVTMIAASIVGTAQAAFDMTLAYAKQREQFGVPIGSFQAVKHAFADMLVALERARASAYFAALTIAEDDARRSLAASAAKVAAGDLACLVARQGIQLHGGIGYTWEHPMHLFARRLQSDAVLLGTADEHRDRIASHLMRT